MGRGEQRLRIDNVVVGVAVAGLIVALIVAAGHKRAGAVLADGEQAAVAAGILDADPPGRAVRFLMDRAVVAAGVDSAGDDVPAFQHLRDLFRRVALGDAADIQGDAGIRDVDRTRLFIDDDLVPAAGGVGFRQFLLAGHVAQLAVLIQGDAGFAVGVPDLQQGADGDVELAVGKVIEALGQLQHVNDVRIHLDGLDAGVVIDGLDVADAVVIVVDIEQIVVVLEQLIGGGEVLIKSILGGAGLLQGEEGVKAAVQADV